MFIILLERIVHQATAIGPFPHEEDAEAYAHEHCTGHIWRIVKLTAPEHA